MAMASGLDCTCDATLGCVRSWCQNCCGGITYRCGPAPQGCVTGQTGDSCGGGGTCRTCSYLKPPPPGIPQYAGCSVEKCADSSHCGPNCTRHGTCKICTKNVYYGGLMCIGIPCFCGGVLNCPCSGNVPCSGYTQSCSGQSGCKNAGTTCSGSCPCYFLCAKASTQCSGGKSCSQDGCKAQDCSCGSYCENNNYPCQAQGGAGTCSEDTGCAAANCGCGSYCKANTSTCPKCGGIKGCKGNCGCSNQDCATSCKFIDSCGGKSICKNHPHHCNYNNVCNCATEKCNNDATMECSSGVRPTPMPCNHYGCSCCKNGCTVLYCVNQYTCDNDSLCHVSPGTGLCGCHKPCNDNRKIPASCLQSSGGHSCFAVRDSQ